MIASVAHNDLECPTINLHKHLANYQRTALSALSARAECVSSQSPSLRTKKLEVQEREAPEWKEEAKYLSDWLNSSSNCRMVVDCLITLINPLICWLFILIDYILNQHNAKTSQPSEVTLYVTFAGVRWQFCNILDASEKPPEHSVWTFGPYLRGAVLLSFAQFKVSWKHC